MQNTTYRKILSWYVLGASLFCTLAWLLLMAEDIVKGRNYAFYFTILVIAAIIFPANYLLQRKDVSDRVRLVVIMSSSIALVGAWVAVIAIWPGLLSSPKDKAWTACEGDDVAAAIAACTALIERPYARTTERRDAYRGRAMAYEKQRDYARALSDYDTAIGIDPGKASLLNDRGVARMKAGDLDGAIGDYDAALRIATRYGLALANRGIARQRTGNLDGAIVDYTQAIASDPKEPHRRYNRGSAFEAKGDLDAARADFMVYRTLQPNEADGREALARIDRAIGHREGGSPSEPSDRGGAAR